MEYNHNIELTELGSAGYLWIPVPSDKYLVKSKTNTKIDEHDGVGSPTKVTFEILALTQEPFEIMFEHKRPWSGEVADVKLFKFNQTA